MDEKDDSNQLAPEIEEQIANHTPQGPSTFAQSPLFYDMLRRVAQGQPYQTVSDWSKEQGHPIEARHISAYINTHLLQFRDLKANKIRNDESINPVDAIGEMERQCKDLKRQIAAEKKQMASHGLTSSSRLTDLQKSNGIALGQLSRMILDASRVRAPEIDEADMQKTEENFWDDNFSRAVSRLITEERSKADGKLRMFQPEKLEDEE